MTIVAELGYQASSGQRDGTARLAIVGVHPGPHQNTWHLRAAIVLALQKA
jgi:hypothetical protein